MAPKGGSAKAADPRAQAFLGREFLTWLWFRCEADGGTFDLGGGLPRGRGRHKEPEATTSGGDSEGETGVVFEDYVALVSDGEEREENIVRRGSAHRSAEARTALLVGKLVSAAKLAIARGDRTWSVTVAGETLDLKSAKYPDMEAADPEERALERLQAMQELSEIVEGLYGAFLSVRCSPAWDQKEAPALTRWIKKRAAVGAAPGASAD